MLPHMQDKFQDILSDLKRQEAKFRAFILSGMETTPDNAYVERQHAEILAAGEPEMKTITSPSTTSASSTVGRMPDIQEGFKDILERGTEKIRVAHEKLLDALENAYAKARLDALENASPIESNDNDNASASVNDHQQQEQQQQPTSLIASCSIKMLPPSDKETFPFSSFLSDTITIHPTPEESDQLASILLKSFARERSFLLFQDSVATTWEQCLSDDEGEAGIEIAVGGEEDGRASAGADVKGREGGSRRTMDHWGGNAVV
ncbi:hypothetical protein M409DRAFT_54584 [Zasmidium cellare ATCC 36951]|uniref:Uncharacterized protein n=1 Tax=Zasmidium cellare ATCC 36951 TaxID=1080233 RepID=A0A6A6CLI9_ZASCE|nr:uncharacterized protein M409DRAFT_54584 [Zasmidium cellare ATCC 36951]KAF2166802.1 hypothetical protein M409DRAFT_54584 [Zasmidium cellare ATCC 36951]